MNKPRLIDANEFAEKMKKCAEKDTEAAHIEADELMCEVLSGLGYQAGVDYFHEMNKWYA